MTDRSVRLTAEELELLNEVLSERVGIYFPFQKGYILEGRLQARLDALGLDSFRDYYLHLRFAGDEEFDHLVGLVANHESFFFREVRPYRDLFEADVLKSLSESGPLRFLCAGCSSGEEAYTLRILADEYREQLGGRPLAISAFDIDQRCIRLAEAAEYGENSLRALDPGQIERYFELGSRHPYALKPAFRQGTRFWRGNLVDGASYQNAAPFDVISCRNVLIYFSETARLRALENLARCLRPGGLLFLSVTESILGLSRAFEMARVGSSIVYRRTAA